MDQNMLMHASMLLIGVLVPLLLAAFVILGKIRENASRPLCEGVREPGSVDATDLRVIVETYRRRQSPLLSREPGA
ncbi:MAG TPA: hypothetical protein VMK05_05015 [Burkholderiales bacterium]|nr:hypothetical protein [Burkholderiales bacterium]